MTDISSIFDKHESVRYNDLARLFWGEYPFRVVVGPKEKKKYPSRTHMVSDRKAMLASLKLPPGEHKTRHVDNHSSFFFRDQGSAVQFIDDNLTWVWEVDRPRSSADIETLKSDAKIRLRENLWFDTYRWSVTFKRRTWSSLVCPVMKECDEWVEGFFGIAQGVQSQFYAEEAPRVRYSYADNRRLFVNCLADVVAIKIALHDHVSQIERCVLHSEVEPKAELTPNLVEPTP